MNDTEPPCAPIYHVQHERLWWGDRALCKAAQDDFTDLGHGLAKAGGQFWLNGAKIKAPGDPFRVLGPNYACDARTVYLIMKRKLKPMTKVSPDDFRMIGSHYALGGGKVWYLDRPVGGVSAQALQNGTLRQLANHYLTDGRKLFFTTKQVHGSDQHGIVWHAARIRVFQECAVNPADVVVTDGAAVWLNLARLWPDAWQQLSNADFANLEPLHPRGEEHARAYYHGDGHRIWFAGKPLEITDGAAIRMIGPTVLATDTDVFHCGIATGLDPRKVHWIADEWYCGPGGLWTFERRQTPQLIAPASLPSLPEIPLELVAETTLRKIFGLAFSIFTTLGNHTYNRCDIEIPPADALVEPRLAFSFCKDAVTVRLDGTEIASGQFTEYYRLASVAWARLHSREDDLLVFPQGNWLPTSSAGRDWIIRHAWPELIRLASALYTAGHKAAARRLAHETLYVHGHWRPRNYRSDPSMPSPLADLAPDLAAEARYTELRHGFAATTCLAAAREVCANGLLSDDDWRVRWEMIRTLVGIACDVRDVVMFQTEIIPQLLSRWKQEDDPLLRECWFDVFEMAALQATGSAWDLEEERPVEPALVTFARPLIEFLVGARVNLALNCARLARLST